MALLFVATASGCGQEPEPPPEWISLDQAVEYDILGWSFSEQLSEIDEALASEEAAQTLATIDADLQGQLGFRSFGSVRGDCTVGGCLHVYFELVDLRGGDLGMFVVKNVYDDAVPIEARFADDPGDVGPVTELPQPRSYGELSPWLADQSAALDVALLASDAKSHTEQLRAEMRETAASLVVRRFLSLDGDDGDDYRDTFVQLQRLEFGSIEAYTVDVLRIRSFDDGHHEVTVTGED